MDEEERQFLFANSSVLNCFGVWPRGVACLRAEFKERHQKIRAFLYEANKITRRQRKLYDGFQIHHIIPLSLNGSSDNRNLVLCCPDLHGLIHTFITLQTQPFPGNYRYMTIPNKIPGKLWVLTLNR